MEFDNGLFITGDIPLIEIKLDEDSEGTMTDHIIAPGVKGLLMNHKLVQVLHDLQVNNIQAYPTKIIGSNGEVVSEEYNIVNVIGRINAVDTDASDIEMHPDFPNQIEFINSLVIKESIVGQPPLFRLAENTQVVIVREDIKETINKHGITGIKFCLPSEFFM